MGHADLPTEATGLQIMATLPAHVEITKSMINSLAEWYKAEIELKKDMDPATLVRLMVVAMTRYAAILAIDVGMTPEQFEAVSRANFKDAFDQAPKFG